MTENILIIKDSDQYMTSPKLSTIKRVGGSSAGVILDKGALEVYDLKVGDAIEIIYDIYATPPRIIIQKKMKEEPKKE